MLVRKKRTLSPLELAARRRNARQSTGPRTAAGKFRSSLNSLKRGLGSPLVELWYELRGEEVRDYRRLHRDLISLLLPNDTYLVRRVAELADAWWEKIRALHYPGPQGVRDLRIGQAEGQIEEALGRWVETLSRRSRKWRHRLERELGGTISSLPELRERIESRLPALTSIATSVADVDSTRRPGRRPYILFPTQVSILLKTQGLYKMSALNEADKAMLRGINGLEVKKGRIFAKIRTLRGQLCSARS